MKRIYYTGSNITLQNGAVLSGRLFLFPELHVYGNMEREEREVYTALDRPGTTGQSWQTLLSDGKVGPFRFRGKIILTAFRYFSRKPCLSGSIYRIALVVQRAAKARIFTIKKDKVMNQAIISRPPTAPMQIRMPMPATRRKKAVEPNPVVKFPPRGSGPVHISTLLNPILEICHHPDRDRLLAQLFSDM